MTVISLMPVFGGTMPEAEATFAANGGMPMYSWGNNLNGRLGLGNEGTDTNRNTPQRIGNEANWVFAATAGMGSFAVNSDGELFGWGNGWNQANMGQGANPSPGTGNILEPTKIGTADNWVQVSARSSAVAAINSNGELFRWGTLGGTNHVPTRIGIATNWEDFAVSNSSLAAINSLGQLHMGSSGLSRVGDRSDWTVITADAGTFRGVTESGQLWNISAAGVVTQIGTASNWVDVRTTGSASAAINEDGELWTWGSGQIGGRPVNAENPSHLPGKVLGTADNWVSLHGGTNHFLAFNEDGELWGWGSNESGQLGDGTFTARVAPTFILQTYGFNTAARGGGIQSIMFLRTTPAEGESLLTKSLQMPEGTPIPSLDFEFTFTPKS
ncbi:MAG: hypothetical protein FWC99_06645, partial [Coriobacteriia bacterium]|nr:hypothetical protein [Coriobacteriia bacterium]